MKCLLCARKYLAASWLLGRLLGARLIHTFTKGRQSYCWGSLSQLVLLPTRIRTSFIHCISIKFLIFHDHHRHHHSNVHCKTKASAIAIYNPSCLDSVDSILYLHVSLSYQSIPTLISPIHLILGRHSVAVIDNRLSAIRIT